jgi:hypothetical protein
VSLVPNPRNFWQPDGVSPWKGFTLVVKTNANRTPQAEANFAKDVQA